MTDAGIRAVCRQPDRSGQHTLAIAWKQHCYKVMLLTSSRQERTLRFYEQAGVVARPEEVTR